MHSLTATRSSRLRRRIPRCLHPPRLWHPLPARMAAQPPLLCVILVLRLSRCHSVAHRQDKWASRHRRTVLLKVILPHVCKAKPPKPTRANLLPDSLVKVCLTWGSLAVHLHHNRLSRPVEDFSVWFHSLNIHRWVSYLPHLLCCTLLATSYSNIFLFFCTDDSVLFDCCDYSVRGSLSVSFVSLSLVVCGI
jgi:hypothetical protein